MLHKVAVVLFNLGGPDSLASVRPFLSNLFSDEAIISLPQPLRALVAWIITTTRTSKAKGIYALMGGASPINQQTEAQAQSLQELLALDDTHNTEYRVFYCMRYWHPMSKEVVDEVKDWGPSEIILLPLYPQFSTSTTGSSFKDWNKAAKLAGLNVKSREICCYPQDPGFVQGYAELIREVYEAAPLHINNMGIETKPRVLFSAHGLPLSLIKAGDPYQSQIEASVEAIIKELGIEQLDYRICYQSKVGFLPWLEPSTESQIIIAGQEGVAVIVVPIAFVSEHSETKVELDIDYRKLAEGCGVPAYYRVSALSTNMRFIKGLANLCRKDNIQTWRCATEFSKCHCRTGTGS